ncbi:MAG: S8 family serine peptidase, partial [Eubacterium sp.]|nr:S8 family serine peptidase [Eubacterium sp.]
MFKRMIATLLAGAMILTTSPVESMRNLLQEASLVDEGEEQATDSRIEESMTEENTGESKEFTEDVSAEDDGVYQESAEDAETEALTEDETEAVTEVEITGVSEDAEETENASEEQIESVETTAEQTEIVEDGEGVEGVESDIVDVPEENTEEATEMPERLPSFTEQIAGVNVSGIDFSSRELLIGTEDPGVLTWDTEVLSEYRGVYLTRYQSVEQTRNAYTYYYGKAEFVSSNSTFRVSDQEGNDEKVSEKQESAPEDKEDGTSEDDEESHLSGESADLSNLNEGDDALSNLNNMDAVRTPNWTIALIDTGINDGDLVDAVSVIGDSVSDDNGHGTRMYQAIREEYPDAKVLSIKAMGSDGKGQASDIYAAIQYALESHVDVINLSLTANGTEENSVVVRAIEDAIGRGITVVGAAGNNASNAKYFIPGCVEDAYIIGAANEKGDRLSDSNYGPNVDFEVVAGSTSEAAARFSALMMRSKAEGKDITDYPNVLINYDRTDLDTDDYV